MLYKKLFYFDIETVGQYSNLEQLKKNDVIGYNLFLKKYKNNSWMVDKYGSVENAYLGDSPISTTFGKIVCISFGYYHSKNIQGYTISSICEHDERELIKKFVDLINKVSNKGMLLSGYMIKSFDIPWVVHKITKYGLEFPRLLDVYGKKQWDILAFDLADEWKQGGRYYIPFDEVAYELGVESPKDKMDGSKVHKTYWDEDDLNSIRVYCEKDVEACLRISEKMLKYKL